MVTLLKFSSFPLKCTYSIIVHLIYIICIFSQERFDSQTWYSLCSSWRYTVFCSGICHGTFMLSLLRLCSFNFSASLDHKIWVFVHLSSLGFHGSWRMSVCFKILVNIKSLACMKMMFYTRLCSQARKFLIR